MVFLRIALLGFWAFYAWSMGQIPPEGLNAFGKFISLSFFLAAPLLYLLPTYEAWRRKHASFTAVALVNVFLGWTLIGWVAAIAWACVGANRSEADRQVEAAEAPMKNGPFCAENIKAEAVKCKHCGSMLTEA